MNNQKIEISEHLVFTVAEELSTSSAVSDLQVIWELARKHHWSEPEVVGSGGMIYSPVVTERWRYELLIPDESTIPALAKERINLILKSGIRPQGFIIAHEIETETRPKVKPLPWVLPPQPQPRIAPQPNPWVIPSRPKPLPEIEIDWGKVGKVAGKVLLTTLKVLGVLALAALSVIAAIGYGLATADPAIIVVTQEGEWVEIFRYYS